MFYVIKVNCCFCDRSIRLDVDESSLNVSKPVIHAVADCDQCGALTHGQVTLAKAKERGLLCAKQDSSAP